MPNITAARPAAGAPIETAWGQEVHDKIEATPLIQAGTVNIVFASAGQAQTAVTFPIPFASPPAVTGCMVGGSTLLPATSGVTASGFTASLRHYDNTAQSVTIGFAWIAVGTAVGG
jgi:hypothetical protein